MQASDEVSIYMAQADQLRGGIEQSTHPVVSFFCFEVAHQATNSAVDPAYGLACQIEPSSS
jgi:hypothetical protein